MDINRSQKILRGVAGIRSILVILRGVYGVMGPVKSTNHPKVWLNYPHKTTTNKNNSANLSTSKICSNYRKEIDVKFNSKKRYV